MSEESDFAWMDNHRRQGDASFHQRKEELSVQDRCILLGSRVVVPRADQDKVLEKLYDSHPGMSRMKSLARSVVWCLGINNDIEGR